MTSDFTLETAEPVLNLGKQYEFCIYGQDQYSTPMYKSGEVCTTMIVAWNGIVQGSVSTKNGNPVEDTDVKVVFKDQEVQLLLTFEGGEFHDDSWHAHKATLQPMREIHAPTCPATACDGNPPRAFRFR